MDLLIYNELNPGSLRTQFDRVLEMLQRGEFRAADVKKMHNHSFYRAKLNDSDRLLFQFATFNERRYLLALEIIWNHQYNKSRFLRGGIVREDNFIPVNGVPTEAEISADTKLRYVNPHIQRVHILDKVLSFDDAQQSIYRFELPVIVIGSAGSGKTVLVLEKMKTLSGHILYVTHSMFLTENSRNLYYSNGYNNRNQEVDFFSFKELMENVAVPSTKEITFQSFNAWFQRIKQGSIIKDTRKLFEEIQGVITGSLPDKAYLSRDEYVDLGVKQSIFLSDERPLVYDTFLKYLAYLKENGLHDSNILACEYQKQIEAQYDYVIVDEVQDITTAQLALILKSLKEPEQFILCGDANQIVHPNFFSWARVKSYFYEHKIASPKEIVHVLYGNYRNAGSVIDISNRLLKIKQRRFGSIDKESNYLIEATSEQPGQTVLMKNTQTTLQELNAKTRRSTQFAIIVLTDDDKAEAKKIFQSPLIFSAQEAKGLEYENVIAFNIVSRARKQFEQIIEGVNTADLEGDLKYARAQDKTDKSFEAHKFYINSFYVALTRSLSNIYLVEEQANHPLFALLNLKLQDQPVKIDTKESSLDDWQKEARKLELQGKHEQVEQIRKQILQTMPVPWKVLEDKEIAESAHKIFRQKRDDKKLQRLLFEYALVCDLPLLLPRLAEVGYSFAGNPKEGESYIRNKYYGDYHPEKHSVVKANCLRFGCDHPGRYSEIPLNICARLGDLRLAKELINMGADPNRTDGSGLNAWQTALSRFLIDTNYSIETLVGLHDCLAPSHIKVKVVDKLFKLDKSRMEYFMFNMAMIRLRHELLRSTEYFQSRERHLYYYNFGLKAAELAVYVERIPDAVMPERRKKRAYISSILSKNEAAGSDPYNRKLFCRVEHGYYILNPLLQVENGDGWINVYDRLKIDFLCRLLTEDEVAQNIPQFLKRHADILLQKDKNDMQPKSTTKTASTGFISNFKNLFS
jgi:hypothetical protein